MNIIRSICAFMAEGYEARTRYTPEVLVGDNAVNTALYGMPVLLIRPYDGIPHYWGSSLLLNKSWSLL